MGTGTAWRKDRRRRRKRFPGQLSPAFCLSSSMSNLMWDLSPRSFCHDFYSAVFVTVLDFCHLFWVLGTLLDLFWAVMNWLSVFFVFLLWKHIGKRNKIFRNCRCHGQRWNDKWLILYGNHSYIMTNLVTVGAIGRKFHLTYVFNVQQKEAGGTYLGRT